MTSGKSPGLFQIFDRGRYSPWYRRTEVLILGFVVFLGMFLTLPLKANLSSIGWTQIIGMIFIYIFWSGLIIANPEKPNLLKNLVAVGIFLLMGWIFVQYSNAKWDRLGKVFFDLSIMRKGDPMLSEGSVTNWFLMWQGLVTAVKIFFFSAFVGTILGLLLAVIRVLVNDMVLNAVIIAYVDFFRAMPMIVMLVVIYSALPFTGIVLSPEVSGIVTLGMIEGAYMSEIFRAGIGAVHAVQTEAARALGLSAQETMRLVILPQAVRIIVPPYTSSLVGLMKGTALCSTITIFELLKTAQQIQAWYANPTPLIIASLGYLLLLLPMTRFSNILEKRWKYRAR